MARLRPSFAFATLLTITGPLLAACGASSKGTGSDSLGDGGDSVQSPDGAAASGSSSGGTGGSSGSSSGGGTSSGGEHDGGGSGTDGGPSGSSSGGGSGSSSSGGVSSDGGSSGSGGSSSGPIVCPAPGNYTKNGGACGTERWNIKTGTDPSASNVALSPQTTTIATLVALAAAGGGSGRESPTETSLWELKDVTMTLIKLESDSDYHIVVSDGTHTMIVEVPYPDCASGSPWGCFISRARAEVDAKIGTISSSPSYPGLTVTVRGVGFFDYLHGQTGVAPNGIELHPVLQICFGQGCTPS